MRNVSPDFLHTMDERTDFYFTAKIEFKNGQVQNLQRKDFNISGNSLVSSPESNSFPLGVVVSKKVNLSLRNDDERWLYYDFNMAKITVTLNLDLDDGRTEMLNMGVFTVTAPESYGSTVEVVAVDDGYKLDKDYNTLLEYPMTIGEAVRDSCRTCGVSLLTSTFHNSKFLIHKKPSNLTHRKFVGLCAMIAGGNGIFDENNRFSIVEYDFTNFEGMSGLDGGIFDDTGLSSYQTGDAADGGTFKQWNTGYEYADGNFADLKDIHVLYKFKSGLTVETDDVVITGIKIVEDEKEYLFGKEGYVLQVENQLTAGSEAEAVKLIGERIVGLQFRPFTGDLISYPLAEFMDLAYIVDGRDRVHKTVLTDIDFSLYGFTVLKCSADSPIRNSSKYYGNEVKAVVEARKETEKQLSAYDLAVQNMNQLAANTMGFYATTVKQADGSILAYRHDKPKLSESKIVYKSGIDGFWVTENYRGTDAATTWKAGFDSNGNAVLNMLSVIGINFDWAHGGTLTLGGKGNGNGLLKILSADGTQIGYIDNTGVHFNEGTFSGSLRAADFSGSKIKGSKFITEKQDNSGYMNVEQGNITFYQEADLNYDDYAGSISPVISRLTDALVYVGGEYVLISGDAYLAGIGVNGFYSVDIGIQGRSEINITRDRVLIPRTLTVGNISANSVSTGGLSCSQKANLAGGFNSRQSSGVTGNLDVTKEVRAKDFVKNININSANYNNPDLREIYVGRSAMPVCEDIGTGVTNELGIAFVDIDPVFLAAVNTDLEYQVFLQKEGQGDLWVDSKESAYFIVKGSANLKFSWSIKCTEINSENKRMEEVDLQNEENSKIEQYDAEIESLKTAMLKEYDDDIEFNLKQEVYMINKEEEALLNESYQNYQYHESRR